MAEQVIRIAAEQGEAAAAAVLGYAAANSTVTLPTVWGANLLRTTATSTSSQAVAMVALSLQNRLEVLNQRITRYPQDAYQRIVAIHSPSTLLGVTTSRIQQSLTVQRFLSEGIPGFVDKSGRRWTIGSYSEMAGRTSVNRAFNDAGIWRMQQSGINLVTVVRGLDSCRKCAHWAGKILSTDGTAGTVTVPHATNVGETVTVNIAGTVDDARAAGWNHPNCRCRTVAYSPGLTVPQGDTTYDEAAEKERAQQRALEREIRAAKRREATAMNDVDRKRAAADVREAQANMRDFIKQTGRNRDSYREQLHFADGRGGTSRKSEPPRALDVPRALSSSMKPHEQTFYRRMESMGETLSWIPEDGVTFKPTNDFTWDSRGGIEVELKSTSPRYSSIKAHLFRAVTKANVQGVVKENFLIDIGDTALTAKLAAQLSEYNARATQAFIRSLWVLDRDGIVAIDLKPKK